MPPRARRERAAPDALALPRAEIRHLHEGQTLLPLVLPQPRRRSLATARPPRTISLCAPPTVKKVLAPLPSHAML